MNPTHRFALLSLALFGLFLLALGPSFRGILSSLRHDEVNVFPIAIITDNFSRFRLGYRTLCSFTATNLTVSSLFFSLIK